ncbi:unnamed protein product [Boreogadus saida]
METLFDPTRSLASSLVHFTCGQESSPNPSILSPSGPNQSHANPKPPNSLLRSPSRGSRVQIPWYRLTLWPGHYMIDHDAGCVLRGGAG